MGAPSTFSMSIQTLKGETRPFYKKQSTCNEGRLRTGGGGGPKSRETWAVPLETKVEGGKPGFGEDAGVSRGLRI